MTRVFVLNAPTVCQTPTVMTVSLPVNPFFGGPHLLHPFSSDRHLSDSVFHQSVILVAVPVPGYRSFISVHHLLKDGPSSLSVLTVTPIDRLHDSDGSNGVKGAAEKDKLRNKAQ